MIAAGGRVENTPCGDGDVNRGFFSSYYSHCLTALFYRVSSKRIRHPSHSVQNWLRTSNPTEFDDGHASTLQPADMC